MVGGTLLVWLTWVGFRRTCVDCLLLVCLFLLLAALRYVCAVAWFGWVQMGCGCCVTLW